MPGEDLIVLGDGDLEKRVRSELEASLGAERQRRYRRFLLAAMGSIPWVGHATDLASRLLEVNKHVPHEVLGERWHLVLQHAWPTEVRAYTMEQQVLKALRTAASVAERVVCTRQMLDRAWTSDLAQDLESQTGAAPESSAV